MKCPKYIRNLLISRAYHYNKALKSGLKVDDWLEKQGIEIDGCDSADGNEAIWFSYLSAKTVYEAILDFDKSKVNKNE